MIPKKRTSRRCSAICCRNWLRARSRFSTAPRSASRICIAGRCASKCTPYQTRTAPSAYALHQERRLAGCVPTDRQICAACLVANVRFLPQDHVPRLLHDFSLRPTTRQDESECVCFSRIATLVAGGLCTCVSARTRSAISRLRSSSACISHSTSAGMYAIGMSVKERGRRPYVCQSLHSVS